MKTYKPTYYLENKERSPVTKKNYLLGSQSYKNYLRAQQFPRSLRLKSSHQKLPEKTSLRRVATLSCKNLEFDEGVIVQPVPAITPKSPNLSPTKKDFNPFFKQRKPKAKSLVPAHLEKIPFNSSYLESNSGLEVIQDILNLIPEPPKQLSAKKTRRYFSSSTKNLAFLRN